MSSARAEIHCSAASCPGLSIVSGLSALIADYDAVLLDQFGVLHDGKQPMPGAIECFEQLAAAGKRLIVLSNTSRRRQFALSKFPKLGFDGRMLAGFVCSGEQAWQHIKRHRSGQRVLWLSWAEDFQAWDPNYLNGLDLLLAPASEADFVLCHGSMVIRDGRESMPTELLESGVPSVALLEALRECNKRRLPMICANPDLQVVLPSGNLGHMPGVIAQLYEQLGGTVIYFGKPHASAFDEALQLLGPQTPPSRVLHVGDSVAHDIAGASQAGIHSLFIASGIHADELGIADGGSADTSVLVSDGDEPNAGLNAALTTEALEKLFSAYNTGPTHTMRAFVW
eukprot:CAMPEP_0119299182 /NCGR_PEP_ID=MMETSP1333-20130426/1294_1 /TAXON_ID=418940 /ORGANISM="Scyphosphaera apsteinii, Strain RCC1455" /LENGTH=339 /DNA_ID=CAMNT_0007300527 /DNA_START=265 /DNA_END=1284 /DNA_ORIENTATION=+